MEASFVDLRKKSAEIIRALKRKERITLLYRGKPAAIMEPIDAHAEGRSAAASQHAAFGIWSDQDGRLPVDEHVRKLRRRRYDAL
ncbi:hypothetical protein [Algiphilus sp.]|uniref:hypothetical protein n=1 Tax=Algiphilus sp. TaxID=1872431 RepID=UPI0025BA7DB8|nr:hypothetical protein [Algiphilus sp.]MCK5769390.1 hypothetical protein [Algiphilus sp.]